jgi:hypothetical protein
VITLPFPLLPTAEQVEGSLQHVAPRWSWDRLRGADPTR